MCGNKKTVRANRYDNSKCICIAHQSPDLIKYLYNEEDKYKKEVKKAIKDHKIYVPVKAVKVPDMIAPLWSGPCFWQLNSAHGHVIFWLCAVFLYLYINALATIFFVKTHWLFPLGKLSHPCNMLRVKSFIQGTLIFTLNINMQNVLVLVLPCAGWCCRCVNEGQAAQDLRCRQD